MPSVPKPRRKGTKHFLKQWRLYIGYTQERAAEILGWSQSKISRIENGTQPYNEDDLYNAANAYKSDPISLLTVNPLKEGEVVDLVRLLQQKDPDVAGPVIRALPNKRQ